MRVNVDNIMIMVLCVFIRIIITISLVELAYLKIQFIYNNCSIYFNVCAAALDEKLSRISF